MELAQRITYDWLRISRLVGYDLLLEGLLRRGYLAYRTENGIFCDDDGSDGCFDVLQSVHELDCIETPFDPKYRIRLKLRSLRSAMEVVCDILSRGEGIYRANPVLLCGVEEWSWQSYQDEPWGETLLPIFREYASIIYKPLPYQVQRLTPPTYVLETGIALLVKALPLAGVFTTYSCDGHGRSAQITFVYPWDVPWCRAVFDALRMTTPSSRWDWDNNGVWITPLGKMDDYGQFSDAEVFGMLNDIQHFARRLMEQGTMDKITRARSMTFNACDALPPDEYQFDHIARCQLAKVFI